MDGKPDPTSPTRRQFIKQFGVTLASLIAARCASIPTPTVAPTTLLRDRLRDYWLQLDWITQQAQSYDGQGSTVRDEFIANHQAVLNELVAVGELDADVAEQVQIAFAAAAYSAWFSGHRRVNICYTPTPSPMPNPTPEPYETIGHILTNYTFFSADKLKNQANLLAEMSASGDISPEAVAQAHAALEQDIAFMSAFYAATNAGLERVISPAHLSNEETWTLSQELENITSDSYTFPTFDEFDIEISFEAAKAARFLVELLLESTE
ncbi:MAG: hypothetical protein GY832_12955 [Chloroflexi bacterium]|nr:hypothetical protein [Chloroflexota bacterium]